MIHKVDDLEITQDLKHSRLEWRIERIGWVVIGMLVLAALLGLLGPGPLSSTTIGDSSTLRGEYDRFVRQKASQTLRLHCKPDGPDSLTQLRLSRDFVDNVDMKQIVPEPVHIAGEAHHCSYFFLRGSTPRTSGDSLTVTFHYDPQVFGNLKVEAGVPGLAVLRFNQFVYP